MKTKEELNALKEEFEELNKKLAELSEDELKQVSGGAAVGREEVYNKVLSILETRLDVSPVSVCAGSSIIEDLGADSLDIIDIVSSTEKSFRIRFTPNALENVKTVQDLCDLIYENIPQA